MRSVPLACGLAWGLAWGCSAATSEPGRVSLRSAPTPSVMGELEPSPQAAALSAARDAVWSAEQASAPAAHCTQWPLWERYAREFVSSDGRVIDPSDERTTSEGQAYAALFALIAADRARFDTLLTWTEANLAQGDLKRHLPAWLWGRRADGSFGVKDPNSASDADVWLAYALLEAARIWNEPRYGELAQGLCTSIATHEVTRAQGLGAVLLPGPEGFVGAQQVLRLNPSYLAIPPLRRFEREQPHGPWKAIIASSVRVLVGSAPRGLSPDWIAYAPGKGFQDGEHEGAGRGSYDAVRSYLWAAVIPERDPVAPQVRNASRGLHALLQRTGRMPERIDVRSEEISETDGPPGFLAVALAYAHSRGDTALQDELRARLERSELDGLYGKPPAYYDQNLAMFALGSIEGRYRFAPDGRLLLPQNEDVCAPL
jgi:endo-1,4-beta-D-glucanase Y